MKAVIFAGGIGTRLWPLSRKNSPKQFEKIIGDKSTLQLAVERLRPEFKPADIFIATNQPYVSIVKKQLPFLPFSNIIGEPEKKDVGPAVALIMALLAKKYPKEPVIILWSDHLVENQDKFKKIIKAAGKVIKINPNKIIFIGQKPRFATDNLGWIATKGKAMLVDNFQFYHFESIKYRPDLELAKKYFNNAQYCWNLGYFVTTPKYINSLFERFTPHIFRLIQQINQAYGTINFNNALKKSYHEMPEISFDNAILEQLDTESAYVIMEDIGWTDVGAWEALKEALEKNKSDNITKGTVHLTDSFDNLIYNYDEKLTIVGVDINELLVVKMDDVLLIAKKTSVSKIKKIVESFKGTIHEKLT